MLYLVALSALPRCLKLPFSPSYAAFTFPFVISAIGMKMMMAYTTSVGRPVPGMNVLVLIETAIACILVVYTIIRYAIFLVQAKQ